MALPMNHCHCGCHYSLVISIKFSVLLLFKLHRQIYNHSAYNSCYPLKLTARVIRLVFTFSNIIMIMIISQIQK